MRATCTAHLISLIWSASFLPYITQVVFFHYSWVLQPLQFSLLPSINQFWTFLIKPLLYDALLHNGRNFLWQKCLCSLMVSHTLLMSPLSSKFFRAKNLFLIVTRYSSLTSPHLNSWNWIYPYPSCLQVTCSLSVSP
jgi:hypothetical protein